jgi:hypothetical protein
MLVMVFHVSFMANTFALMVVMIGLGLFGKRISDSFKGPRLSCSIRFR